MPRLAERQRHHDNAEATTAEVLYCRVTAVPVLETFMSKITFLLYMSVIVEEPDLVLKLEPVVCMYESDSANHEIADQESKFRKNFG